MEESGDDSARQSWIETTGLCPVARTPLEATRYKSSKSSIFFLTSLEADKLAIKRANITRS